MILVGSKVSTPSGDLHEFLAKDLRFELLSGSIDYSRERDTLTEMNVHSLMRPLLHFFKGVPLGCMMSVSIIILALAVTQAHADPVPSMVKKPSPSPKPAPKVHKTPRDLPLTINAGSRTATLNLPSQFNSVVIEYRSDQKGAWKKYKSLSVKLSPASIRIALPADYPLKSWRATGLQVADTPVKKTFPAAYYKGTSKFSARIAPSYAVKTNAAAPVVNTAGKTVALASDASAPVTGAASVNTVMSPALTTGPAVQADIWETLGNTAYFFNQLRGLQVIDLSTPSNPVMAATYRLPAVGQDLYVIPGQGGTNYAILLTSQYDSSASQSSTGVLMIGVSGSTATLVSSNSIPGWMADSRMVGNQLFVTTQQWVWDGSSDNANTTLTQVVVDAVGGGLFPGMSVSSQGSCWPVISAGDDWLALSQGNSRNWQNSSVTLYSLSTNGPALLTTNAIALAGNISDEYDVQYSGGILSAVTSRWFQDSSSGGGWHPVTMLQNFTPDGILQGSIQIDSSNWYAAARFSGSNLFVTTSWSNQNLYLVDNSTATNPVVAGQINLPGYSSRIETEGNQLVTLGYDTRWNLAASLYDVATLSNPTLLSSVSLPGTWGYSPASYDQNAFNVMPGSGLITIPYSCYNSSNAVSSNFIQLIGYDPVGGTLSLEGSIPTAANPLRAAVLGSALASISQRELVTADITTPQRPVVLADMTLAWTVDKIAVSGNYLIEITAGTSWDGETPSATVATLGDPDNALTQIPLGDGTIRDAKFQGNNLYVLRQNPANSQRWWGPFFCEPCFRGGGSSSATNESLFLDVYDASSLPVLTMVGSTSVTLPGSTSAWDIGSLLFPSTNCAAVVVQPQALNFWWWATDPIALPLVDSVSVKIDSVSVKPAVKVKQAVETATIIPVTSGCRVWPGYGWESDPTPASVILFQINDPTKPVGQPPFPLTDTNSTAVKYSTAGSDWLVFGYAGKENWLGGSCDGLSVCTNYVAILDVTDPTTPILGSGIPLPGRLQSVTSLTNGGFLAWTKSCTGNDRSPGSPQVQVSSCDGVNVYQITSRTLAQEGPVTAYGNSLFIGQGGAVSGYTLDVSGNLNSNGLCSFSWNPSALLAMPGSDSNSVMLLGSDGWNHFFGTSWNVSGPGAILDVTTPQGNSLTNAVPQSDGSILSPSGSYGVDTFLHSMQ